MSFAWTESELEVVIPAPVTVDACLSQDEIDDLFAEWLEQFDAINGCNPTTSALDFTAPDVCEGGTVTVLFSASDECNEDEGTSTFTVPAHDPLTLSTPADETVDGCLDQSAIDAAFEAWKEGVTFGGGCTPELEVSDEDAPRACEGGSVTVTFTASDDCEEISETATFTVTPAPAVTLTAPADETVDGCLDQAAIDAAFAAWIEGVSFGGGCVIHNLKLAMMRHQELVKVEVQQ